MDNEDGDNSESAEHGNQSTGLDNEDEVESTHEWSEADSEYDFVEDDKDNEDDNQTNVEGEGHDKGIHVLYLEGPNNDRNEGGESGDGRTISDSDSDDDFVLTTEGKIDIPDSEDDLSSLDGSDSKRVIAQEGPAIFDPLVDQWNPPLKCNMTFSSFKEAIFAIQTWNVIRGRQWKFLKNDKRRVSAKCPEENCKWYIYVAKQSDGTIIISKFQPKHKCYMDKNNPSMNHKWIARRCLDIIKETPKITPREFKKAAEKRYKISMTKWQAYKARKLAGQMVSGTQADQFELLGMYCKEIIRSNPGSTVKLKYVEGYIHPVTGSRRFLRVYVCYAALRDGFLSGCRKLIGLDGTFLKGPMKGVLLTAVGIDPNNGFYPVAWAVTEGETKESWEWFLSIFADDIKVINPEDWTIMSDKQKGLIAACESQFSSADHRFCVKHLHSNFVQAGFRGNALRKALWMAAKCTTENQWHEKMKEMSMINVEAVKWFDDKDPRDWCRAFFSYKASCDVLLNNNCESFNSKIVDARLQPIVDILEEVRLYIIGRMLKNRNIAYGKWKDKEICPRIFKMLQGYMKMAASYSTVQCNDFFFEVLTEELDRHTVDLKSQECSCRKWQLTNLPCVHAIAACWKYRVNPMSFVGECYTINAYKRCYDPYIRPLKGKNEWPKDSEPPILPPLQKKCVDRNKVVRRKTVAEVLIEKDDRMQILSRKGQLQNCKYCGISGHNRRSCKVRKEKEISTDIAVEVNEELDHIQQVHKRPQKQQVRKKNLEIKKKHNQTASTSSNTSVNKVYSLMDDDIVILPFEDEEPRVRTYQGFNPPRFVKRKVNATAEVLNKEYP